MKVTTNDAPVVLKAGIFSCQVCVVKTMPTEDVIAFIEEEQPCGTTNGWIISSRVPQAVQCEQRPNCVHFLLDA